MTTTPTTTTPPATTPTAKLKRTQHWLTREFASYLSSNVKAKFVWGVNDCCLFAANAIEAFTGVDIASDFRGKYTDEASAFALIKSVTGGTTVADAAAYCAAKHNLTEWVDKTGKPLPLMAKRGDLVVVANGANLIAGVIDQSGLFAACMSETGIIRLSIHSVQRAWHIPA